MPNHWNHRVVKRTSKWKDTDGKNHTEVYYRVEECYYKGRRKTPFLMTDGCVVHGESIEDIKWTLKQMLKCLDSPIVNGDKLSENKGSKATK